MDIYTEHHPHHEIGPIEHLKYVGAQYYTTLLSRLTSHIKNEDVHVSNEDRYKWDNKADKTALRELEMKMAELTPSSDKDDIDLSTYATHTWVDENFARKGYYPTYEDLSSRYALKTDIPSVADFATKVYVDNAIANIKPGSSTDMSGYATKQDVEKLDDFVESAVNGLQDQINNIDHTLSPASDKELGGFKTGYLGTGNNYAVKMNGEYAYVSIPFSTTGGDDLVVTSLYNIEVVSNTLKLLNNVLSGSISWRISEAQGSSYSYIAPGTENIYTTATILPNNRNLQSPPNTEDGTYVGYAANIQIDVADYVSITVEKSGIVVARQVIPILNPGRNGEDGTTTVEYQNLEYPVIRLRGEYKANTHYNSGDESENGVYYIDIVSYEGGLYKALVSGNNAAPTSANNQWEPFSIYGQSAFYNLLIANEAFITALASKQIVVVDNEGKPVAGLLSNDANVTTETGTFQRSGVRIFAGANDGNIAAAPFRVYDDGSVVIEKGSFTSTNGGATAQLSLYGHQSNIQPHLYLENSVGQTAEMTALGLTFRSAGNTTSVAASGIHTPYIEAAQGSFSNKLDVNGTVNIIGNLLLNGNQIGDSIDVDTTQNKPQIGDYLYSDWTFGKYSTAKDWIGRCIATEDDSLDGNYVWARLSNNTVEWATEFGDVPTLDNIPAGNQDKAKEDITGWYNTKKLIDTENAGLFSGVSFPAADLARQMFDGKGYLPAYGELFKYADAITSIFGQGMFWSSTESSSNHAWYLSTNGGAVGNDGKKYKCKVIGFCRSNPYPKPQDLWIDVTTAQSFYTFQIKNGMLLGIFHGQSADDLAKAGDKILQLNIDNGDSAAYYKTSGGQMIAW